jgi:hypothetical protein
MARESGNSYLDVATAVLEACGRPMTAREITEEAIHRGLLKPAGKTPEATMSAALYTRAEESRITRLAEPGPRRARRGSVRWMLS